MIDVMGGNPAIDLDHDNPINSVATDLLTIGAGTLNTNPTLAVDEILADADMIAASDVVDVTVGAYVGGEASITVTFGATLTATTTEGSVTAGTNSATAVATDDVLGITINGKTATGTAGGSLTTATAIASRIAAIWTAAQASTVSDSMFDVTASSGVLTVSGMSRYGSATSGKSVAVVVGTGTSTATTPLVAYKIGYTTDATDNTTASTNVIITVESNDAGEDADELQAGAVTGNASQALTASATLDVATAADATADSTTPAVAGASVNRLTWISGS